MPVTPEQRKQALADLTNAILAAEEQSAKEKVLTEEEFKARKQPLLNAYQSAQTKYRTDMKPHAQWREDEYRKSGDKVRAAVAAARAKYKRATGEDPPEGV